MSTLSSLVIHIGQHNHAVEQQKIEVARCLLHQGFDSEQPRSIWTTWG
jgi:hypothetical protein